MNPQLIEIPKKPVRLTLAGLDGNAFALMGAFRKAARQQGWSKEAIAVVLNQCMSSDYEHLLRVLTTYCVDEEE